MEKNELVERIEKFGIVEALEPMGLGPEEWEIPDYF